MSLAIECGATYSTILYNGDAKESIFKMGSANFKNMTCIELEGFFRNIKTKLGTDIHQLGIGMPGIISMDDKLVNKFYKFMHVYLFLLYRFFHEILASTKIDTKNMARMYFFVGGK
jgi:hypothetical protein